MKARSRNEGSSTVDMALLFGMPVVIAILVGILGYLA